MRKTEKKVKVTPSKEQLSQMVLDYLENSQKHLFQLKYVWDKEFENSYYKIFPVIRDGSVKYLTMIFSDSKSEIKVRIARLVTTKNHLGMFKNDVFPQYIKHKSVKQSKELRERFKKIQEFIESNPSATDEELTAEVQKILRD